MDLRDRIIILILINPKNPFMKIFLLSVLSVISLSAFSQWQPTSILSQGENISAGFSRALACDEGFNTYQTSTDGGVTWSTTGVSGVPSTGLRFGTLNGSTLYAHYNDKIYQSTNGTTWSLMTGAINSSDIIRSMCVHNGTVFATGSPASGTISRLYELSGSSWALKATHNGTIIVAIRSGSGALFAGTTGTLVMKSTNNGSTFAASNGTLNPVNFYDKYARSLGATSTALFFGNDGGRVFRSTDGGSSWSVSYNSGAPSSSSINDIYISSSNAILVACDSGFVYSLNNGANWYKKNSGLAYNMSGALTDQLLQVTMSGTNVIVSTKGGKVYYQSAAQLLTGITEIENTTIKSLVYPNPANDHATIEASELMFEKNCEVKVIDVLGREVSAVEMKNGKAELNLSSLAKGIYTYSIYNNKTAVSKGQLVVN